VRKEGGKIWRLMNRSRINYKASEAMHYENLHVKIGNLTHFVIYRLRNNCSCRHKFYSNYLVVLAQTGPKTSVIFQNRNTNEHGESALKIKPSRR